MGKINFEPLQKIIIEEFKKDKFLSDNFYFTGGTALSVFYFGHRLSEDVDFFTENKFPPEKIIEFMNRSSKKHAFTFKLRQLEGTDTFIFSLDFEKKGKLKVDFNHYPYKFPSFKIFSKKKQKYCPAQCFFGCPAESFGIFYYQSARLMFLMTLTKTIQFLP